MGLFDKKYCDICGEKIGFLGNRKLDDGNMCSKCAKLISPLMTDRKSTSVADMKEHLAYREANKASVSAFQITATYGTTKKIFLDETHKKFIVSYSNQNGWEKENPDVIPFSEVTSCVLDTREHKEEEFMTDAQGNKKSFTPRRYRLSYDFYVKITLSSRWFSNIDVQLNTLRVESRDIVMYQQYQNMAEELKNAFLTKPSVAGTFTAAEVQTIIDVAKATATVDATKKIAEAMAAAQAQENENAEWQCPSCGAKNTGKFCESCGTKKP